MLTSTQLPAVAGDTDADDFVLDVRIVESGPAAKVLMANTDDGCDTQKSGDC